MTQIIFDKKPVDVTIIKELQLQFPIMLRQMTDEETKEYHLKRLHDLILKSHEKNAKQKQQEPKINEELWRKIYEKWTREETYSKW